MSSPSTRELLLKIPLFASLTTAQSRLVCEAVVQKSYRRGAAIVEQHKKSDALYIMLRGKAQVVVTHPTRGEAVIAILRHGDHVGEMSLIDNAPHSATVRAMVHTTVLALEREAFALCLPQSSSMAYAVMNGLVQRLRHANRSIESLALMDMHGRVAKALLELSEPDPDGNRVIDHAISRQEVGKMVGATRETVGSVLKSLTARGFLELRDDGSSVLREYPAPLR